jgi:hypothetical protein
MADIERIGRTFEDGSPVPEATPLYVATKLAETQELAALGESDRDNAHVQAYEQGLELLLGQPPVKEHTPFYTQTSSLRRTPSVEIGDTKYYLEGNITAFKGSDEVTNADIRLMRLVGSKPSNEDAKVYGIDFAQGVGTRSDMYKFYVGDAKEPAAPGGFGVTDMKRAARVTISTIAEKLSPLPSVAAAPTPRRV